MADIKDNSDSCSISDEGSLSGTDGKNGNCGRWTKEEHDTFLLGLGLYGRDWKKVATAIKTRTPSQIRSHAQKYFQKLSRSPLVCDGPSPILGEQDKDAFTVLEYLETTLRSLKRRRDELECSTSNGQPLISIKDSTLINCKNSADDARSDKSMASKVCKGKDNSEFGAIIVMTENGEISRNSIVKFDSKEKLCESPRVVSDTTLNRLHAEELIAVQVLCGTRPKNQSGLLEDSDSRSGNTSNNDSEEEGNISRKSTCSSKDQETESDVTGSGCSSD